MTIAHSAVQQHAQDIESIPALFGSNVFNLSAMRERLPNDVFNKLVNTIKQSDTLDPSIADVVANAMKDWAVEKGATHFCHWFQPLTGLTAEKHDSFISPTGDGGILLSFSGKDLVQGEPDASSFPSASLRESFEARGYTIWDCTSPVFVKEDGASVTMFIPSAFCSYTGKALDYKTPLLRARNALNRQAMRVLKALGNTTSKRVTATFGAEQEYFLIDRKYAQQRLDLIQTGRTLFGAPSPKGMAMSVHYFGTVHERVASFMRELNMELWKLGVSAKTQHNEISPCQYEIAPVHTSINVACDHNQLTMEALQKVAERHGLECLLHAKPFASLGGSCKHINWSMATDDGLNLLDPGKTPHENEVFLTFLCAVIKAVDKYATLMQASVADVGNDHRLGAMEAPPAIISIFLGDQLTRILDQLAEGNATAVKAKDEIRLGVSTLPPLPKDLTDRNRTSPFAFTGNRFEFRTPGSASTTSRPGHVLCVIVADVLAEIADELEKADDVNAAAQKILKRIAQEHKRIIFNGDNYSEDWVKEAARRGLRNPRDTVDALSAVTNDEAIELFVRHRILSRDEYEARVEIDFERYAQDILIEGRTAVSMAKRQILPAVIACSGRVASALEVVKKSGNCVETHSKMLEEICLLIGQLQTDVEHLEVCVIDAQAVIDPKERATAARDRVIPAMQTLRQAVDALELIVDADLWPLPTYAEMVFKL